MHALHGSCNTFTSVKISLNKYMCENTLCLSNARWEAAIGTLCKPLSQGQIRLTFMLV